MPIMIDVQSPAFVFIVVVVALILLILISKEVERRQPSYPIGGSELLADPLLWDTKDIVGGGDYLIHSARGKRSSFEHYVITTFEDILNAPLPTAQPNWLRFKGKPLELDGYNSAKKIAIEVQGPLHTKFYSTKESRKRYLERLEKDAFKISKCADEGVKLIVVDMRIPLHTISAYARSRLSDIGIGEKPADYIAPFVATPEELSDDKK